ncbi:unnamed protein product [Anisakis simplex]|uniref:SSD domain-containing protein n=1 Tax=Anisakis simplex TaxID=6269 RepID=A0A0M3KFF6_ANISI|nr:unnamed protein product [Anisakis simplex]
MKLTYPLTTVGPYKMNIGKLFFDRKVNKRGVITGVGTAAIYFTTFVGDSKKEKQLELFEKGVLDQVKIHNQNKNNSIKFVLHGANTVTQEVQRGVGMTLPYYIAGAGLLTVFVLLSFAFGSMSFQQFNVSVLLLGSASLISPLLASISAIGLILLLGFHTNVLVLISPFLTLAIGIGEFYSSGPMRL